MRQGRRAKHLALLVTAGAIFLITSTGFALAVTRNGGPGNDVLVGTNGADTLNGRNGNDVIRGLGGNDRLRGGPGVDRVSGGAGNDFVNTRDGRTRDYVFCGAGRRDRAVADANDVIDGKTLSELATEAEGAVDDSLGGASMGQLTSGLAGLTSCESLQISGQNTTVGSGGAGSFDLTQQVNSFR